MKQYYNSYIDILHIAVFCNVCCLNVINTQSLHHKNDWTSKNLGYSYTLISYAFIWLYRVYILYFSAKTHIPI